LGLFLFSAELSEIWPLNPHGIIRLKAFPADVKDKILSARILPFFCGLG
jgi:hypothetical protein